MSKPSVVYLSQIHAVDFYLAVERGEPFVAILPGRGVVKSAPEDDDFEASMRPSVLEQLVITCASLWVMNEVIE